MKKGGLLYVTVEGGEKEGEREGEGGLVRDAEKKKA